MNSNNNNRIRDSSENESRTVTVIHKALEESLDKLKGILSLQGYTDDNIKLIEINSQFINNLKSNNDIKDAEELKQINNLNSELLVVYADKELELDNNEVTDLSEALQK